MQDYPFEQPLEFSVKSSNRMAAGFCAIHAGACLSVLVSGAPLYLQALLVLIVLISFWHTYGLYISQRNPDSVVSVLLNVRNEWWLKNRAGQYLKASLQTGAFVHPQLIVLFFRVDRENYRVILMPDRVNPDDYRRLRVRLRFNIKL